METQMTRNERITTYNYSRYHRNRSVREIVRQQREARIQGFRNEHAILDNANDAWLSNDGIVHIRSGGAHADVSAYRGAARVSAALAFLNKIREA
jgi:hypothetical protein